MSRPPKDLTGLRISHLNVLEQISPGRYRCKCKCGAELVVSQSYLRADKIKSCGCHVHDKFLPGTRKLYEHWRNMLRCVDVRRARNIPGELIYPDWMDYAAFATWAISMGYVDGQVLNRVPFGKSYSPDNCWWVWRGESRGPQYPRRRKKINGVEFDLRRLSDDCGVPYMTLRYRLNSGYPLLDAITRPVGQQGKKQ